MKHCLALLFTSILAGRAKGQGNIGHDELTRIIGGSEAVDDRHSYAVLMLGADGSMCGGSLIARDVVLTAAHCMGATDYAVLGEHDIEVVNDGDGEVFAVREVILHPDYSQMLMSMYGLADNDFMLVFLEGASASDDVITVKLNSDTSLPIVGQSVTVMGWGDTDISDDFDEETPNDVETSTVLMNVDVSVISNEECDASEGYIDGTYATYSGRITANMLCAISNGKDSCQGDSGGPMVIKGADGPADVQVGVVSWAYGCAIDQFPGVYARVSRAYDWIQIEVCKGSSYASEAGFDCGSIIDDSDGSATPPITQPTNPPILAPTGGLPTNDDLCTICPNGSTAGDNYTPYADIGDFTTCGEIIELAEEYEAGSEDCGLSEAHELYCCPTVPENPCIICPNGVLAKDDFAPYADIGDPSTCAEIIELFTLYETASDFCGVIGEGNEALCCPADSDIFDPVVDIEVVNTLFCGMDYDDAVSSCSETTGCPTGGACPNGMSCFAGITCAALPPPSSAPPMDLIDNTCIICPGGASAGEDFAPYADLDGMLDFIGSLFGFGDSRTCGDLIEAAKQYNTGSEWCGLSEMHELHCCPTVPVNPCIICPNGATAGDDFVPQYEGNTLTCKDIIDYDNQYEAESDYCGFIGKYDELYCCPEEDVMSTPSPTLSPAEGSEGTVHTADNPCIICPDGATAGDDFAPYTDSGNSMTCGELIDAAKSYEAQSAWCGLRNLDAVYCCPTAPANPCIICPFGAFAGDDFVLRPSTGSTTTCREIIDLAMRFESGSQYCKLNEADEALCCPLVEGSTVAPSPTEITSSSPTSGSATPLSPTSVSPAGYAFLSAVSILYIFAL